MTNISLRKQQLAESEHTYPISEIFGPTIQGEGPMVGTRTFFVRFAGCDYDCSWCDTKYAVLPKYPGWHVDQMGRFAIANQLKTLGARGGDWITLSGGNPALFADGAFVVAMLQQGLRLAMETQGSRVLTPQVSAGIECLVVSPKPPSSGMQDKIDLGVLRELLAYRLARHTTALKFVVFDQADLTWAFEVYSRLQMKGVPGWVQPYLSIGTDLAVASAGIAMTRGQVLADYEKVVDWVLNAPDKFCNFTVLPQVHVLLWGQKRGV